MGVSAGDFEHTTYTQTADFLRQNLPDALKEVQVGIVCGSGLGGLVHALAEPKKEFLYQDIPNFPMSTVPGHAGKLVFGILSGKPTVCMVGRMHFYEGHALSRTTFPIRIMKLLGASVLVVTNAAGGLNRNYNVGDIMMIADHVSFCGLGGGNPLVGTNVDEFGVRFPAMSDAYDDDLRQIVAESAAAINMPKNILREGIYTFVSGPSFETRAEARFLRDAVGADCVGMSTVPEVVVARHCGMRVAGLSLITNKVAVSVGRRILAGTNDVAENKATHEEVLATSAERSELMGKLVEEFVKKL